ncbi:hypothetical protein NDU88_001940 [Pleurodeles waltl]|uniref:Uncharacterized protein n=1 Tax=Pleurodeles waltl TaxID=8319 RepID=A0AAV7U9I4_PLEWA|nr:hypothetical protein NDU88_001940 [Pleurodeles waltl]
MILGSGWERPPIRCLAGVASISQKPAGSGFHLSSSLPAQLVALLIRNLTLSYSASLLSSQGPPQLSSDVARLICLAFGLEMAALELGRNDVGGAPRGQRVGPSGGSCTSVPGVDYAMNMDVYSPKQQGQQG